MGGAKQGTAYQSFSYLDAGSEYRAFELAD